MSNTTGTNQACKVKPNSLNKSDIDVKLESIIRSCIDDPHYRTIGEAKQAITSLIIELVSESKPERQKTENMGDTFKVNWARGHNVATDQFEQNLLKALGVSR